MKRDDLRHGTDAGWQQHRKEGRRPCAACRVARNEYMRGYRSSDAPGAERGRARNRARNRALARLARNHPKEFDRLYRVALTEVGATP